MKDTTEIQLNTLIELITNLPKRIFEALDKRENEMTILKMEELESLRKSKIQLENERKTYQMENKHG